MGCAMMMLWAMLLVLSYSYAGMVGGSFFGGVFIGTVLMVGIGVLSYTFYELCDDVAWLRRWTMRQGVQNKVIFAIPLIALFLLIGLLDAWRFHLFF